MSDADITEAGRLPVADAAAVRATTWRMVRDDKRGMLVTLVLNCLAVVATLIGPWLLGRIIDEVQAGTTASAIDALAAAVVAGAAAQILLTRFARYAAHRFGERALARLREEFVDHVFALPTSVVERAGAGDLMARSSQDVSTVGFTLSQAVPEVVASALHALFLFGVLFVLDVRLGLCGLLGAPIFWGVARWYLARSRAAYLAEGHANSVVSEDLAATAAGARTVEAMTLQRRRIDVVDRAIAAAHASRVRTLSLRSVLFPVADLAHFIPLTAVLLVGGLLYTDGVVSLGVVIAAGLYMWQLADPIDRVLMWMEQLQRSGASLARVIGVAQVAGVSPPSEVVPLDDRIEANDVRYAYDRGRDVLHGVSLTVRPGERLAIVGPSGAGKSTLGRLLAGVDEPHTGSVTVGGAPLAQLAPAELRRRVVLVTQEHHVFIGTLRDNLAIAAPTASDDAIHAALIAVGVDWVERLPDGLDTELRPGATTLDAPQAQQLALARVVLANPRTVILDEATALLDPTTARRAERSLAAALDGRTVIAIAHRLRTAHDAHRVVIIDDGRVAEQGSHRELIAAGGVYAALWASWHGAEPPTS